MRNVAFIVISFWIAACCPARVIYVDVNGPNDPGTGRYEDPFWRIQDAIDDPNTENGDIIEIQPGIYTGDGNYDLDPRGLALTFRSTNPDDPIVVAGTIINPEGAGRGFSFNGGPDPGCTVSGLTIRNAKVPGFGGAVYCDKSSPTIVNCVITGSFAQWYGGAVYCSSSHLEMKNCIISNNSSGQDGGGVESWWASPRLTNCIITNNHANGNGGGIDCYSGSSPIISNCTIIKNSAAAGGGLYCDSSDICVVNTILWANESDPNQGPQIAVSNASSILVGYSNVQGADAAASVAPDCTVTWDANNIDTDPCFASFDPSADANTWDLYLQSRAGRFDPDTASWIEDSNTSRCIDFGDPDSDWRGEPWPNGKRINIGAYGGTGQASKNGNPADFDVSGAVDFDDLADFAGRWLAEETCIQDLNADGTVEFTDFAYFGENWLWPSK